MHVRIVIKFNRAFCTRKRKCHRQSENQVTIKKSTSSGYLLWCANWMHRSASGKCTSPSWCTREHLRKCNLKPFSAYQFDKIFLMIKTVCHIFIYIRLYKIISKFCPLVGYQKTRGDNFLYPNFWICIQILLM